MWRVLDICKCLFGFFVGRIYSEWIYWMGIRQRCPDEDCERGDTYVHQLIRNLTDDREQEFHHFLKDRLFSFKTPLFFINLKGRLELCHNSIAGFKSLKQVDTCLTKNKDLMHVSANLKAGPIHFDSWVIVHFLAFERRFKLKGTLRRVKILCNFTVNSARDKNGSFERLFIRELKYPKFWIEEGLGFLKVPVNLTLSIATIFLYFFIRNCVECVLEYRIRKTFPEFKFPIEGNARELSSSEVSGEPNAEDVEDTQTSFGIFKQSIGKYLSFSYWYNARNLDVASNPSRSSEKCASNGEELSNIKMGEFAVDYECVEVQKVEASEQDMQDKSASKAEEQSNTKTSKSADDYECTKEVQTDERVESRQDDKSRKRKAGTLFDEISLCKRKLNYTFQNALKCKDALEDLNYDYLVPSNDEKELQLSQTQIDQDINSIEEQSEVQQCSQNMSRFEIRVEESMKTDAARAIGGNSEQIKTLQSAPEVSKDFESESFGKVIGETEEIPAFNDDAKYVSSSASENAIETKNPAEILSFEDDATICECKVVIGLDVVERMCLDTKESNYESPRSSVTGEKVEELPLEKDQKSVPTSKEIENVEIGQEITLENETKHVVPTSADVTDEHEMPFLDDSQYAAATCIILTSEDMEMPFEVGAKTKIASQLEAIGRALEERTVDDEVKCVLTCVHAVKEALKIVPLENNLKSKIAPCLNEIATVESKLELSSEYEARELFADIPCRMLDQLVGQIAMQTVKNARTSKDAPDYEATCNEIAKNAFEPTLEAEVKYPILTLDSSQEINTLPYTVKIVEIEEETREMLPVEPDTECPSTCELESEGGSAQGNQLIGSDLKHPCVSTNVLKGSTEEIGVIEAESENSTTDCEYKDSMDECVQEKPCFEACMENSTTSKETTTKDGVQEKLNLDLESNIVVFSRQTKSVENDSETLPSEDELKNEISICEPEVGSGSVLKQTSEAELAPSCEREVSTEERCANHDLEEEYEIVNTDENLRNKSEVAAGKEGALQLSSDIQNPYGATSITCEVFLQKRKQSRKKNRSRKTKDEV